MKNYKHNGFELIRTENIEERGAVLAELRHIRSGCPVYYLDRDDENKTFAIGFKTIPADDTGIFHILEHSVLCGSDKFPLKDPFSELIKGSLTTFLNAMTYGEKTLYPVASKNDKAFHGLCDVYLDAVFHPNAVKSPYIFMQEGRRYELDENSHLNVNGVVYNEMKAAYSSADDYADYITSRLTYPNGTYSHDSGGNPDAIPELTFEDFKAAHARFYHPSNAAIFLDGDVDLDDIMPLIDGYLSEYEKNDFSPAVDIGGDVITERHTGYYPIDEGDSTEDKTRIYLTYKTHPYGERNKKTALSLVCEAIADSNNAPLTKRILESGLCESFYLHSSSSLCHNSLEAKFIGVRDGCEDELIALYEAAVKELTENGIPDGVIEAALARYEFATRESDYGSYPMGILFMTRIFDSAFFGTDAADSLRYEELFSFLHERLGTGYYTEVLSEILGSAHTTVVLHPDRDFNEKREEKLRERLEAMRRAMSAEELERIASENAEFYEWQAAPDSEEALAAIPKLTVEDVMKTLPKRIATDISEYEGVEIISHPLATGGISYADLYFDLSDIPEEDLPYSVFFHDLVREWDTEEGDAVHFSSRIKKHLGMLVSSAKVSADKSGRPRYSALVQLSCLGKEKENACSLLEEYLYRTSMNNPDTVVRNLKQLYTILVQLVAARPNMFTTMRANAKFTALDALTDSVSGIGYHMAIKKLAENAEENADKILAKLKEIRDKYFVRERLTVGITANDGGIELAKKLIDRVKAGGKPSGECKIKPQPRSNDAIIIPSPVSCISRSSNLAIANAEYSGAYGVLCNIVGNDILWNEIRVKGGAYDAYFTSRHDTGTVTAYSYADPTPARTSATFLEIPALLRGFLDNEEDLTRFIIGAIGRSDNVSTPRLDGSVETQRYLMGLDYEKRLKTRMETLSVTKEILLSLADVLDAAFKDSCYSLAASRGELDSFSDIDCIIEI